MAWHPTRKLVVYIYLVIAGLAGGLAFARLEPVVLVTPLAVAVVLGYAGREPAGLTVEVALDRDRATEGETVRLTVEVVTAAPLATLEVLVLDQPGLEAPVERRLRGVSLARDGRLVDEVELHCERWGNYRVGEVWVRARDRFGMFQAQGRVAAQASLRVHPTDETLLRLVRPLDTQMASGSQVARIKADGVEFADLRPFVFGDRVRSVNWRATARRGAMWVNEQHPDRTGDVVILVDAFTDVTLPDAIRAAHALIGAYLSQLDRVGLVSFGGVVHLVRPGTGTRQLHQIVDALLMSQVFQSFAWKDVNVVPPRVLPPKAMVVAISPLEDERVLNALTDLRSRGADMVVIEVAQDPYVPPAPTPSGAVAYRLWKLDRQMQRERYRGMGIPVVEWTAGRPLTEVLREVQAWPRGGRWAG